MPISSIFSVDMLARWKDFIIDNVGLRPRFTTNDDIRLGSINEAPKFFFLSTNTLKVYCQNSMVGDFKKNENVLFLSAIPPKSSYHWTPFTRLSPPITHLRLDWLHILRWWWRKQWCWKRSAAWWFFAASHGNVRVHYHRIKQSNKQFW